MNKTNKKNIRKLVNFSSKLKLTDKKWFNNSISCHRAHNIKQSLYYESHKYHYILLYYISWVEIEKEKKNKLIRHRNAIVERNWNDLLNAPNISVYMSTHVNFCLMLLLLFWVGFFFGCVYFFQIEDYNIICETETDR